MAWHLKGVVFGFAKQVNFHVTVFSVSLERERERKREREREREWEREREQIGKPKKLDEKFRIAPEKVASQRIIEIRDKIC